MRYVNLVFLIGSFALMELPERLLKQCESKVKILELRSEGFYDVELTCGKKTVTMEVSENMLSEIKD